MAKSKDSPKSNTARRGRKEEHIAVRNGNGESRPTLALETIANELYPNDRLPTRISSEETCLELYRRFLKQPKSFALEGQP